MAVPPCCGGSPPHGERLHAVPAHPPVPLPNRTMGVTDVGVVFHRLLQTLKLERDAFVWMDFNDRATGDAVILVAGTQVLIALGTGTGIVSLFNPVTLVSLMVSAAFFWLLYTAATYVIVTYLLDGHGTFALFLRVTGFAFPSLLLVIFSNLLLDSLSIGPPSFALVLVLGAVWFVVIVSRGITYAADLPTPKALIGAIGGYVAVTIVQAILGGLRLF